MENYAGSSTQSLRAEYKGLTKIGTWVALFLWGWATLFCNTAHALTAADVSIRTPINQATTVDLTASIDNPAGVTLTVGTPHNGTAVVVNSNALTVTYTPAANYIGEDNFTYTVTAATGGASATGLVTIIVGTVDLSNQTVTTPSGTVENTFKDVCYESTAAPSADLKKLCDEFSVASPEQRTKMIEQLAPEEVSAQTPAGNLLATQQLRNVGGRLAALRQGAQGVSVAGLSFVQGGTVLSAAALRQGVAQRTVSLNPQNQPVLSAAAQPGDGLSNPLARSNLGVFVSGTVSGGDRTSSANEDGFKHASYGLTTGADYRFSNTLVAGGALGFAKSAVDFDLNSGTLDVHGISFTGYGTYYLSDKTYLEAVLGYNAHKFKSTRRFDYFAGATHVQARTAGKSNSKLIAASVGGGYEALTRGAFTANLSARYDYLSSALAAYRESGAPGLDLAIQKQDTQASVASLGTQLSYALSFRWGVLLPQCSLAWNHGFNDNAELIKGSFVGDQTQTTFAFKSDNPDRDYTTVGLGASLIMPGGNTSFVHYETTRGKAYWSDYNVALGMRWEL
ncbi:MAG: autotransporter domain-containing protein [Gammaproteobacteria bacterium]|nr:autotransporter domain-containing protein [Gammaproteobacteria bacterium]